MRRAVGKAMTSHASCLDAVHDNHRENSRPGASGVCGDSNRLGSRSRKLMHFDFVPPSQGLCRAETYRATS